VDPGDEPQAPVHGRVKDAAGDERHDKCPGRLRLEHLRHQLDRNDRENGPGCHMERKADRLIRYPDQLGDEAPDDIAQRRQHAEGKRAEKCVHRRKIADAY
jgi:hypothetical protein